MPYMIKRNSNGRGWCIVKKNPDGSTTTVGHSTNKQDAAISVWKRKQGEKKK